MTSEQTERACQIWRTLPPTEADATPDDWRVSFETLAREHWRPAPDVVTSDVDAGGVPALWVRTPDGPEDRTLLYLHGGGYLIGSPSIYVDLASQIGRAAGAQALVPSYRKAPENPFPAAVEDGVTAFRWLIGLGVSPGRIVVAGDSAGGGLAVATLTALRDRGDPQPAAGVCLSPWVDMEMSGASMASKASEDPIVQRELLQFMSEAYLGGSSPRTPLASPLHGDLTGLPPLLVQVGTREVLLDDAVRLSQRAREASVEVVLQEFTGMPHVFQAFASMLPEARDAIEQIGSFIRERTSDGSPAPRDG